MCIYTKPLTGCTRYRKPRPLSYTPSIYSCALLWSVFLEEMILRLLWYPNGYVQVCRLHNYAWRWPWGLVPPVHGSLPIWRERERVREGGREGGREGEGGRNEGKIGCVCDLLT